MMTKTCALVIATVLWTTALSTPAFATSITVTINTSAVAGTSGGLAFDLLVPSPPSSNFIEILNFTAPGSVATLPSTSGGLVEGDLILPPFNVGAMSEIEGGSFFNELVINFVKFGSSISFTLFTSNNNPIGGNPPDEFSLFLLDSAGLPLFPTSDPLGADALFTFDITASGTLKVFNPATVAGSSINVVVPGGVTAVPEPTTIGLIATGAAVAAFRRRLRRRTIG
jgi:hypothetical protein